MINVSEATKSAYLGDSIHKTLTISFPNKNITFTNSDIVSESFELTESIETERYLTFKGCIASQCKFQVAENVQDLRGEYVTVTIKAGNTQTIDLFKGYVDEQNNETQEDIITEFICYDALYKIGSKNMQSWVNGLTFPITVKNLRNSLFSNLGIAQESKTLINDSLSISENFKTFCDNPSATDIMKWICEVNAVFGQIGRDGKFKYRELKEISEGLYPSETTYPGTTTYPSEENVAAVIDTSHYINLDYEPYEVDFITKIVIYDSGGLDVAYSGSGNNVFGITDNPIAFSVNMTKACQAILAKVGSTNYLPVISMECVGLPYIECGDNYTSFTKRNVCRTYVLQRTLKGIQALKDNYSSDSDRNRPEHKATAISRTNSNKQTILDVQADIVQFKKVVADEITATNAKFNNLDASKITTGTLSANRIGADTITVNKLKGNISKKDTGTTTAWELDFTGKGSLKIGEINANKITAGYISADRIKANSIEVEKLTGTIKDSSKSWEINLNEGTMKIGSLEVGSITGTVKGGDNSSWKVDFNENKIVIGTLSVKKITGNIDGGNDWGIDFNEGSMSIGSLEVGSITGSKNLGNDWSIDFDNGTMSIGEISVGKITGSKSLGNSWSIDFDNGSLTIGEISANSITSGTINAEVVTIENLTASNIKADSITADKLNISASGTDQSGNDWSVGFNQYGSSFNVGTLGTNNVRGTVGSTTYGQWGVNFNGQGGEVHVGYLSADYITTESLYAKLANMTSVKVSILYATNYVQSDGAIYGTAFRKGAPESYIEFGGTCQVKDVNGVTRTVLCRSN